MGAPNLRQIRNILYRLKREFGVPLVLHTISSYAEPNLETGTTDIQTTSINIRRAIKLNVKLQRTFVYDLSFIAANKNFTTGGLFDKYDNVIIVDAHDAQVTPQLSMYFMQDDIRYDVKDCDSIEGYGYIFGVNRVCI